VLVRSPGHDRGDDLRQAVIEPGKSRSATA
jgi:hypothetical protein